MNYNLIKIIEEIKKELSNKYLFDNFDIIVQDDDESITFWFTHEDIKGDKNFIEKFLKNAIDLLGKKGYKYTFNSLYPNPTQITETTMNIKIPNDSTKDLYSLIKVK